MLAVEEFMNNNKHNNTQFLCLGRGIFSLKR